MKKRRFSRLALSLAVVAMYGQQRTPVVCAPCHSEIAARYATSAMANTSGRPGLGTTGEDFAQAAFQDPSTGMAFRVLPGKGAYKLEFERPGTDVRDQRTLDWFIGSGHVGRSYLTASEGFLYQSPVSYFTAAKRWGPSPGFQNRSRVEFTRAIEPSCLRCHSSAVQPIANTRNRYASPPFLTAGITCDRCHGPAETHVARMRSAAVRPRDPGIVNPRKLDPERRDSICAQCHLTGAARVARAGTKKEYSPGDRLADHLAVFVWSGAENSEVTVTSHYEKLAQSRCKKSGGDALWCASCHDPHGQPPRDKAASFFRERCLTCHQTNGCKETIANRQSAGDDCTGCHMPKAAAGGSEHMVYTDHSIPRRPRTATAKPADATLRPFWPVMANERDLALAYSVVAMTEPGMRQRAFQELKSATLENPNDVPLVMQLAQFYDRMRAPAEAMALYDRILAREPNHTAALVNRGTLHAQNGNITEAIRMWKQALLADPAASGTRMNLAMAQYRQGDIASAKATVEQLLRYDPDHEAARGLLVELSRRP